MRNGIRLAHASPLVSGALASLLIASAAAAATYNVASITALRTALGSARSGDEIVVAAGDYSTTTDLYMSYAGVTLRGATGNRDDVVIRGGGFNSRNTARIVLHVNADNCTVKDLTLGDCYWHALFFENSADYAVIRNVRIFNAGEQVIKGVPSNTGGLIEGCLLEYTAVRINDGQSDHPDDYLGGIDLHGANGWTIRDNIVRNIIGQGGDGDSGIFDLYKLADGQWTSLAQAPCVPRKGAWYSLKVEVKGSEIKGYVDGNLVLQARDSTYPTGGVGIGVTEDAMTNRYRHVLVRRMK